jgi:hypothetical protein
MTLRSESKPTRCALSEVTPNKPSNLVDGFPPSLLEQRVPGQFGPSRDVITAP